MHTSSLNSMAFDNFEAIGLDYLSIVDGGSFSWRGFSDAIGVGGLGGAAAGAAHGIYTGAIGGTSVCPGVGTVTGAVACGVGEGFIGAVTGAIGGGVTYLAHEYL